MAANKKQPSKKQPKKVSVTSKKPTTVKPKASKVEAEPKTLAEKNKKYGKQYGDVAHRDLGPYKKGEAKRAREGLARVRTKIKKRDKSDVVPKLAHVGDSVSSNHRFLKPGQHAVAKRNARDNFDAEHDPNTAFTKHQLKVKRAKARIAAKGGTTTARKASEADRKKGERKTKALAQKPGETQNIRSPQHQASWEHKVSESRREHAKTSSRAFAYPISRIPAHLREQLDILHKISPAAHQHMLESMAHRWHVHAKETGEKHIEEGFHSHPVFKLNKETGKHEHTGRYENRALFLQSSTGALKKHHPSYTPTDAHFHRDLNSWMELHHKQGGGKTRVRKRGSVITVRGTSTGDLATSGGGKGIAKQRKHEDAKKAANADLREHGGDALTRSEKHKQALIDDHIAIKKAHTTGDLKTVKKIQAKYNKINTRRGNKAHFHSIESIFGSKSNYHAARIHHLSGQVAGIVSENREHHANLTNLAHAFHRKVTHMSGGGFVEQWTKRNPGERATAVAHHRNELRKNNIELQRLHDKITHHAVQLRKHKPKDEAAFHAYAAKRAVENEERKDHYDKLFKRGKYAEVRHPGTNAKKVKVTKNDTAMFKKNVSSATTKKKKIFGRAIDRPDYKRSPTKTPVSKSATTVKPKSKKPTTSKPARRIPPARRKR